MRIGFAAGNHTAWTASETSDFGGEEANFAPGALKRLPWGAVRASIAANRETPMSNGSVTTLKELDDRIAIVRDNIRQLIEQAAAQSGAGDESRNADRLADQQAELDRLTAEREALLKRTKRK